MERVGTMGERLLELTNGRPVTVRGWRFGRGAACLARRVLTGPVSRAVCWLMMRYGLAVFGQRRRRPSPHRAHPLNGYANAAVATSARPRQLQPGRSRGAVGVGDGAACRTEWPGPPEAPKRQHGDACQQGRQDRSTHEPPAAAANPAGPVARYVDNSRLSGGL